jgi:GntR family transcriptional regulator of arabinose operon
VGEPQGHDLERSHGELEPARVEREISTEWPLEQVRLARGVGEVGRRGPRSKPLAQDALMRRSIRTRSSCMQRLLGEPLVHRLEEEPRFNALMRQYWVAGDEEDVHGMASGTDGPPSGVALFAWVKQELLDSIARGEFSPDEPFVTQREIVERFGVSTTTAVRALNELVVEGVVVRRRGRGTFVAQRSPSRRADRATAPATTPVLAYVSPDRRAGMHDAELLAGLSVETAALGYQLTVAHSRGRDHEEQVLREIAAGRAQAVVLFAHDRSTAAGVVEELQRAGVVTVLVDRYLPGLPTDAVLFDDFAVGYDVTTAMIDRGHRSMAVLWSETDVTSVRDRLAGHRRALRDRGLPELPERSALRPFTGLDPGARRRRLHDLLASGEPLTALMFGNAPTLAIAVSDLLAMDVDVPGSMELASMDQSIPDAVSPLSVVSARLPTREMGRRAARLVHERLQGADDPARHVVLPAELQVAVPGRNTLVVSGADEVTHRARASAGADGSPQASGQRA